MNYTRPARFLHQHIYLLVLFSVFYIFYVLNYFCIGKQNSKMCSVAEFLYSHTCVCRRFVASFSFHFCIFCRKNLIINEQTGSLPPCELRDSPCKQKQQQVETLCVCSPQAKSRQPVATHCSSISAHLYPNNNYCLTARPTLTACLLNNGIVKRRSADLFVTPPGACG